MHCVSGRKNFYICVALKCKVFVFRDKEKRSEIVARKQYKVSCKKHLEFFISKRKGKLLRKKLKKPVKNCEKHHLAFLSDL